MRQQLQDKDNELQKLKKALPEGLDEWGSGIIIL
jgi:hypothetical protein